MLLKHFFRDPWDPIIVRSVGPEPRAQRDDEYYELLPFVRHNRYTMQRGVYAF